MPTLSRAARELINVHGSHAVSVAERRAADLDASGVTLPATTWHEIADAVRAIEARVPPRPSVPAAPNIMLDFPESVWSNPRPQGGARPCEVTRRRVAQTVVAGHNLVLCRPAPLGQNQLEPGNQQHGGERVAEHGDGEPSAAELSADYPAQEGGNNPYGIGGASGAAVGFWDYFRVGASPAIINLAIGTLWLWF